MLTTHTVRLVSSFLDTAESRRSTARCLRSAERTRGLAAGSARPLLRDASGPHGDGSLMAAEALQDLLFGAHVAISKMSPGDRRGHAAMARSASSRVRIELALSLRCSGLDAAGQARLAR